MDQSLIKKQVPLASLSTYQIGGPAEYFCEPTTEAELKEVIKWARAHNQVITVLGGGSNILISDEGVRGLVIRPQNEKIEVKGSIMTMGATALVKTVSEQAFVAALSGLEWAIGIPGFVGGAIRGNAGAHGGSFDRIIKEVVVFDSKKLVLETFSPEMCRFTYRHSFFKDSNRYIIWEAKVQLQTGDTEIMEKIMEEFREYRRTSQPAEPSAGCVFKNLLVAEVEKINPAVIVMAEADNKIRGGKIGAGYLIQKLNLSGYQVGGAEVSDKHANFVVNKNNAQAKDILLIMKHIQERVEKEYQIVLEPEIQVINNRG